MSLTRATSATVVFEMINSASRPNRLGGLTGSITSLVSKDGAAFSPTSNSASEISGSTGAYSLLLTSSEMDAQQVYLVATATGADPVGLSYVTDVATTTIGGAVWDITRSGHTTAGTFGEGVASVQGNVTGSVASVTGNVGGNVVGSVGSVTGNVGGNVTGSVGSVTGNVGGNVVGSVASVTGNVGGNVTGNVSGSVGSVATNGITASSIASNAITAAKFATDAIDSNALATSAVNEIRNSILSDSTPFPGGNLVFQTGAVVSDGGNTATSFKTNLPASADDHYKDSLIEFTSGSLNGQVHKIGAFTAATGFITLAGTQTFTSTPTPGDTLQIINK